MKHADVNEITPQKLCFTADYQVFIPVIWNHFSGKYIVLYINGKQNLLALTCCNRQNYFLDNFCIIRDLPVQSHVVV